MESDKLMEWRKLAEEKTASPWMWPAENGIYRVEADPWRIVDPQGRGLPMPGTIWIDRVFVLRSQVVLADWRSRTLRLFDPLPFSLSDMNLPEPVDVSAMEETEDGGFWILVRSQAQLIKIDSRGTVLRRYGTRLGVSSESRLGFEWPEDALFRSEDSTVLVADSGNHRLVRLNTLSERFTSIPLPLIPHFILHDGPEGWLVSDGADSLLWGSDRYGPMRLDRNQPMVCCQIIHSAAALLGSDDAGKWGHLTIHAPGLGIEELLPDAALQKRLEEEDDVAADALMKDLEIGKAIRLLECAACRERMLDYLNHVEHLQRFMPDVWNRVEELEREAVLLHRTSRALHGSEDQESVRIDMAVHGFHLKKKLAEISATVRSLRQLAAHLTDPGVGREYLMMYTEEMTAQARSLIGEVKEHLNSGDQKLDDEVLVRMMARYVIARRVLDELGREIGKDAVLSFHRSLAAMIESLDALKGDLYWQKGDFDRFRESYETAIGNHPDRPSLLTAYIDKLIGIGDLDAAAKRLAALPDQRREHLNARLAVLYRQKGDLDRAARHLRKELDLFPNKLDLIIKLLEIAPVDEEELKQRLKKALVGSERQIDSHYHLGRIFLCRGKMKEALDSFLVEAELYPENQNALIAIQALLFDNPDFRKTIGQNDISRLWTALKSHLQTKKNGSSMTDRLPSLLFVLNHLTLDKKDSKWLKDTLDIFSNTEWKSEVKTYMEYCNNKSFLLDSFSSHPDYLSVIMEHFSCRDSIARMLKEASVHSDELIRNAALRYPEGFFDNHEREVPDSLTEQALKNKLAPFPFIRAQVLGGYVYYSLKNENRLMMASLSNLSESHPIWTFSSDEKVFWMTHSGTQTLILWDQKGRRMIEIDGFGNVLAQAAADFKPEFVLRLPDQYVLFARNMDALSAYHWETRKGFTSSPLEVTNPPKVVFPINYDPGKGLCVDDKSNIYSYDQAGFHHLCHLDHYRYSTVSLGFIRDKNQFLILEQIKGVPTQYLSLFSLEGALLQRTLLSFVEVNWLGLTEQDFLLIGKAGHWVGTIPISFFKNSILKKGSVVFIENRSD